MSARTMIRSLTPQARLTTSFVWIDGCLCTPVAAERAREEYRYLRRHRGKNADLARHEVVIGLVAHEGATPVRRQS